MKIICPKSELQKSVSIVMKAVPGKTTMPILECILIDAATNDANNLRLSAVSYTDEMMANMGQIASSMLEDAAAKYNEFVRTLQASVDVIKQNRAELSPQLTQGGSAPVQEEAAAPSPAQADSYEPDDYDDDLDDDFDDFD